MARNDEEVRHVERVLVEARERGEDALHRALPLAEDGQVEGEVTQRDGPPRRPGRHQGVHPVERRERDEPQGHAPGHPAHRQRPVLGVEAAEERPVAAEHERSQPEQLHLLHVAVAGEDPLQVVETPALRRAPRGEAEPGRGEARLGHEGGDGGGHHHQHAPGREPEEQRRERHQGDRSLGDGEPLHHQRERARRGLPARVLHLVVDLGVLEVAQLERERLLQDALVHRVTEPRAEQLALERRQPAGGHGKGHEPELEAHQCHGVAGVRAARGGRHHRVDDELPGPGDGGREERLQRGEEPQDRGAPGVGAPDEVEGARHLTKRLAQRARPLGQRAAGGRGRKRVRGGRQAGAG